MKRVFPILAALLAVAVVALATVRPLASQTAPTRAGSEACQQCHEEQSAKFASTAHGRIHGGPVVADCESCHGPGSAHVAAGGDKKDPGFATIRNPKSLKPAEANAMCQGCHSGGDQFYWSHSAHARNDVSCLSCHSIHGATGTNAQNGLLAKSDVNALCLDCHRNKRGSLARSAHMPLREGSMDCASCHNPHGSPTERMLRGDSVNDLCVSCHADKRGPFTWEHAPVRENCLTCHDAHGSNNDKSLSSKRPYLCQRCHIATRHPATLYDAPDLAGNRLFNRSCTNCHSQVHGSNHPSGKTFLR